MRSSVYIVALAAAALILSANVLANDCSTGVACKPWQLNGKACARSARMNLRFSVDVAAENYGNSADDLFNGTDKYHVSYGFCPVVDQLQTFTLNYSAVWAAAAYSYDNTTGIESIAFSSVTNTSYVRVYGTSYFGSPDQFPPAGFDSSAIIYQNVTDCATGGNPVGPAIATFLVLNITMTNGKYRHVDGFDQGVQVGFFPTCDVNDKCQFGAGICMGKPGRKNCAQCIQKPGDLTTVRTTIFTSYYGTDSNGRRFMSGSDNPINFRELASDSAYSSISDSVDDAVSKL